MKLTSSRRAKLPKRSFVFKKGGPKGTGRYPIEDKNHARNALSRVSQYGTPAEKAAVRAKVKAKYPDIGQDQGE